METGTKVAWLLMMEGEIVSVLTDARWMLVMILLCVIADFRFGWGESHKRYNEAVKAGDTVLADKYKWHTSRAWRRTMNKLMDYIVWITMGMVLGMVALKPFGVDYTYGGVVATLIIVCLCELPSACGHFFYLHGVHVEKKSLMGFIRAFTVAFARRKDPDIGDALDEGFRANDKDNEKRKGNGNKRRAKTED